MRRASEVLCVERYAVRMVELSSVVARHDETVREGVDGFRWRDDITDALRDDRLSQAKTQGLALLNQN